MIARAASSGRGALQLAAPMLLAALLGLPGCTSSATSSRARRPPRSAHAARHATVEATAPAEGEEEAEAAVPPADAPVPKGPLYQYGVATYYADYFAGRRTAAGEPYDPSAFTAAHRTLPFGAIIDVARNDGRHIAVRINDRGPFVKGRIIDLSRRAATAIGLVADGTARVSLRIISLPPRKGQPRRK